MINIYQYNIQPINTYKKTVSTPYIGLRPLKNDTVSFTSKNLLTSGSDNITEKVKDSVLCNRIIGFGSEGTVYDLPDTDYCVKIFDGEGVNNLGQWNLNVSSQDKINHVVAKAQNNSIIMKKIKGEALKSEKPNEIFNLPKKSYRDLLIQITKAYDECLKFDDVPTNVIYNKKDKSLTAIDFYEPNPDVENDFHPLQALFKCLKSRGRSDKDKELNKLLGLKLLNVVNDELTQYKNPEFTIDKDDVNGLLYDIYASQDFEIPNRVKQLRKSINKNMSN